MIMPNLASKGYNTVDDYVQDVLSRIERSDESLTTLQIDDLHYPMCDLQGGDYLDSETIAELLTQAPKSPHIHSLELRFVEFDETVSAAFQKLLLLDPSSSSSSSSSPSSSSSSSLNKSWETISITACSGLSSDDYCALAAVLDRCHTLHWHHNDTPYDGLGTLGMSLANSTQLRELHLTRENLKGDSARALLDPLGSNNSYLTKLVLNFCRFDDSGVDALADALAQNSSLQELDLGACYLNDQQVERVVLALKSHPTLWNLVLTLNGCHFRGTQALSELLQQRGCTLEYLNLSHQKDSTSTTTDTDSNVYVQPIATALLTNTSLKCLRLSRNRLQCKDVASLFYALQTTNQTLRVLDLNSNPIECATMLASALPKMHGLRELYLLKNEILSPQSATAILQALRDDNNNNNSNSNSSSNNPHTLEVLELRPSFLPYVSQIRYELALNAGGRRILSSQQDIPLGLWPKVLERSTSNNSQRQRQRRHGEYVKLPKEDAPSYQPDTIFHMLQASALLSLR